LLMFSSARTSPTADTFIVPHFHLGYEKGVSAHVISSFTPLLCALNTIRDEKCQSFCRRFL
jgi:hypothetical protein